MALEAVVLQQDLFGYGFHGYSSYLLGEEEQATHAFFNSSHRDSSMALNVKEWDTISSSQGFSPVEAPAAIATITSGGRRKRQRGTSVKNLKEVEHQRMTHITVERKRRKQMNDYLSVLRSMMPPSYVQRGDQASIVGGAINFVKELEQLLQSLEAHRKMKKESDFGCVFSEFFSFPQYSTLSANYNDDQSMGKMADVEVTMAENHANLKILLKKQPKQLLKMVTGLYSLCLSVLHINVTTVHNMVLYSFSVKVEDECQLSSVNEISAAVYEMVGRVQEETVSNIS